jgi:hypothetical protein
MRRDRLGTSASNRKKERGGIAGAWIGPTRPKRETQTARTRVPVVRKHGRSLWRCRGHPLFQRLKQMTDVFDIDAFADFESATSDTVTNRW